MSIRELTTVMGAWLLLVLSLSLASSASAAPLNLSRSPLFLGVSVDPNIFFMVDDSGSMDWEILAQSHEYYNNYWLNANVARNNDGNWLGYSATGPGGCTGRRTYTYMFYQSDNAYNSCSYVVVERQTESVIRDWRILSSDFNLLYYNPEIDYAPWPGKPNASFTAARSNPQPGSAGYNQTRNLSDFVFYVAEDDHGYTSTKPRGPGTATDGPNGEVDLWDSHVRYTVGSSSISRVAMNVPSAAAMKSINKDCTLTSAKRTVPYSDCFGTSASSSTISGSSVDQYGRTLAETQQNIANWYQYSRKRSFVTKGAIASVITSSPSFRFGLSVINDYARFFVQVPQDGVSNYSAHNSALLEELYSYKWDALGTPLRTGLERVGRYFDDAVNLRDPIISACQQNFAVLFTDGFESGNAPASVIGNADGDGHSRTLADVAKYYYDKDLSPLPNQVPTSILDSASHQHMVTFTVAFGVQGLLVDTDNDGWPNPPLTESSNWGNPFNSDPEKIDDLWHAAYNSKGVFVAAQTPQDVVDAIRQALANIADRVSSSASVATNSGTLSADSFLYQARFDSADWTGQLLAFGINPDGSITPTPAWNAASVLNGQNYDSQRRILTYNPAIDYPVGGTVEGRGVPFRWPSNYKSPSSVNGLSWPQIEALLTYGPYDAATTWSSRVTANQNYGQALTDYLRGQRSNEIAGYGFRYRNSVLGDIVNSDPRYVGRPNFRYPDNMAAKPYSTFRQHYANRPAMVYVGANDGMLHGFAESNGSELIAYVPNAVFRNLPMLARPDYMHRYYADGGPNIVDAYLTGRTDPISGTAGAWRSILASGLGGGGQAVYALDVTDPSSFSEANAASLVLWEFDDDDDRDMGYSYGKPQIAKMANGQWAAVFGNGYNNTESDGRASTSGHAVLYIVNLETGALIRKIDTGIGSTSTPNGLATPVLIDSDGDQVVDYIYAGDLTGRLWKFDVTSSNSSQWDVAYKQGSTRKPLFTTQNNQPITTQPQVAFHPDGLDGFMVYFGTGKYLELDDNSPGGQPTQSFYGIWDKNQATLTDFTSSSLLKQYVLNQYEQSFDSDGNGVDDEDYTLRDVSDYDISYGSHMGWQFVLQPQKVEGSANASNFGERQVSDAIVRDGRVIFTTLIPSQQPCDFGGNSFIMQLDYRTGGKLPYAAFDLNGDGLFDANDGDASGRMSSIGIVPTLSILSDTNRDVAFASGSSGDVDDIELNTGTLASGRQSWRQLE